MPELADGGVVVGGAKAVGILKDKLSIIVESWRTRKFKSYTLYPFSP
jgi:hypothetical protein